MEISKLRTLETPDINDVIPMLDINGGVSGKPRLKKTSLASIFELGAIKSLTINTSLLAGDSAITISKHCILTSVSVSSVCWLRFYKSQITREADRSRNIATDPTGNHGLILELKFTSDTLSIDLSPAVIFSNTGDIYYLDTDNPVNTTITYLTLN